MLSARAEVADALPKPACSRRDWRGAGGHRGRARGTAGRAERPLAIVGGGGWSAAAAGCAGRSGRKLALPVGASFRCQDYLDNRSSCYVGDVGIGINPKLAERVREADLLLVLGARLGEITTSGYSLVEIPRRASG